MASAKDLAKRASVTLIRCLAGIYYIALDVKCDSTDENVRKAYRTLSRKVHPDRGGKGQDQQKLNAALWAGTASGRTASALQ